MFALLYPAENTACGTVAISYASALADPSTFRLIRLEDFCRVLAGASAESWTAELSGRYLGRSGSVS